MRKNYNSSLSGFGTNSPYKRILSSKKPKARGWIRMSPKGVMVNKKTEYYRP